MKKLFAVSLIVCSIGLSAIAGTWTTLDMPGAASTCLTSIDGSNIVGFYSDFSDLSHGFLFNGSTWTTFDVPGGYNTRITDIDGYNIIGTYQTASDNINSFFYDGTNLTTINIPGAQYTAVSGIDGDNIIGMANPGQYSSSMFLYNHKEDDFAILESGGIRNATDLDGDNIIGFYYGVNTEGFLDDGTNQIIINMPGANEIFLQRIDGSNIVGYYWDYSTSAYQQGFLYNGSTWTTLKAPGAIYGTVVYGIDGDKIVGSYDTHGFIYTIPEPATIALLALGSLSLIKKKK